ncbi:MAG: Phage antitermination protein [Burkholderiaceae bacterium]|nr:Phage antitermination protein [Burkholderiaceae bacterium]
MSKWIHDRLVRWGEFISSGRAVRGGLSPFPAYRLVHAQSSGVAAPVDVDVLATDGAMAKIRQARLELYEVGYCLYVSGMAPLTVAGRVRCHVNTVYARRDCLFKSLENIIKSNSC